MGILDKLLGKEEPARAPQAQTSRGNADQQAVERYRYLLRTAPPDAIEQAHQEAFAQLTPEQRAQVLAELSREVPASERGHAQPEPNALARLATRAELRQPGTLERVFGGSRFGGAPGMGGGPGMGMGGSFAGTLLSSIAGTFIGTAIAHQFLDGFGHDNDHQAHDLHGDGDANDREDHAENETHEQEHHEEYASNDDFADDDLGGDDFGGDDFDV
ncbi:MAG TPA: hypothetical protein VMF89_12205 [Polyangiales bacterium]|nr:hypothetical protein [Polyangiales bacterium]